MDPILSIQISLLSLSEMEKTELSGSSPWEIITSWFTPKILFCALNIMIGAIFVSNSNLKSHTKQQDINDHDHEHYPFHDHQLRRPPSLLERVRSFDFSLFPAPAPHPHQTHQPEQEQEQEPSPSLLQKVKSIKFSRLISSVSPPPAETHLAEQSQTVAADETEEKGDQIQPATTTGEGISKTACLGVDEEVDAKADDFITRFRQHLKMQRLESLLRNREMLKKALSFSK